jgi:hypothetical protein
VRKLRQTGSCSHSWELDFNPDCAFTVIITFHFHLGKKKGKGYKKTKGLSFTELL